MAYHLDCEVMEELALLSAECLSRSNYDRLTCMDSERVEVLHITDSDAVVITVTHYLILDLLPSLERLLDENLRRE
jgi:hypothetical protein